MSYTASASSAGPMRTRVIPFDELQIFECQTATVHVLGATSSPGIPLQRVAIYVPALGRTFEIGRQIKKSIYGEVVGGSELQLEENPPVYTNHSSNNNNSQSNNRDSNVDSDVPAFRRLPYDVAIKIYQKAKLARPEVSAERPENELSAMLLLAMVTDTPCAHLMPLVACCADEDNLYAIMPYLPSEELFDTISIRGPYQHKSDIQQFLMQMLTALKQMRIAGVAHRDLSLENTLILQPSAQNTLTNPQYVIIDFGMALRKDLSVAASPTHAVTGRFSVFHQGVCGKRSYIAPEVLANDPPRPHIVAANRHLYESQDRFWVDLFQCDVWALGVMLFMLSTGMPPVDTACSTDPRFRVIKAGKLSQLLRHWQLNLDQQLEDLLNKMLVVDPMHRLTLDEVAAHPYLQQS